MNRRRTGQLGSRGFWIGLALLFLIRGLQIQCLYPPLEGPDEYQHVAYLVYLQENGGLPVYRQALVPPSLYPDLVRNPHCTYDWQQTREVGCLRYRNFYDRQAVQTGSPAIPLYQAQHPPLYYLLFFKTFAWLRHTFGFRAAVYAGRLLNIGLAAVALLWLLIPLRRLLKDDGLFRPVALAISLSPMFMIYVSRISNDALALAWGGLTVWQLMLIPEAKRAWAPAARAGALLGLGLLTRLTLFSLLPTALLYLGWLAFRGRMPGRRALLCALVTGGVFILFTFPYLAANELRFGTPWATQETIAGAASGQSILHALTAVRFHHLRSFFIGRLVGDNLWTSGWSFLMPDGRLVQAYYGLLIFAGTGAAWRLYHAATQRNFRSVIPSDGLVLCLGMVLFTWLVAYTHALLTIVNYGHLITPSYYVMPAYPAFLTCAFAAAKGHGRTPVRILAAALAVLFLVTEYGSLLQIAVKHWADTEDLVLAFRRLATVHPRFPSPGLFLPLAVLTLMLWAYLSWNGWRASSSGERAKSGG